MHFDSLDARRDHLASAKIFYTWFNCMANPDIALKLRIRIKSPVWEELSLYFVHLRVMWWVIVGCVKLRTYPLYTNNAVRKQFFAITPGILCVWGLLNKFVNGLISTRSKSILAACSVFFLYASYSNLLLCLGWIL